MLSDGPMLFWGDSVDALRKTQYKTYITNSQDFIFT